ncbi:hypothetical protein J5N97_001055 [Dioscorea zingiberensis]|uniref:Uncharacterized protein n=1 Tax=Dioscorea zingiberensis TaxID=325984 RepID=A0A9D5H2P6_9LILI|nr:hypothetical protein J5N97_001055 [Dioscorea zingiberensis]
MNYLAKVNLFGYLHGISFFALIPHLARPKLAPARRERSWISSRRQSPADKRHPLPRPRKFSLRDIRLLPRLRSLWPQPDPVSPGKPLRSRFQLQEAWPAAHQPPILLASLLRNFLKLK